MLVRVLVLVIGEERIQARNAITSTSTALLRGLSTSTKEYIAELMELGTKGHCFTGAPTQQSAMSFPKLPPAFLSAPKGGD